MRKYDQSLKLHRRSKPKYLFCFVSSELFLLRNVYGSVNIKTVLVEVFFDSIDQNQRTTQIQRVSLYWNLRDFHLNCKRMIEQKHGTHSPACWSAVSCLLFPTLYPKIVEKKLWKLENYEEYEPISQHKLTWNLIPKTFWLKRRLNITKGIATLTFNT